ncbi:MAG: HD-GYP domain-containing protein [Candidatus Cloacimonetes bacterium]|nr:HD-GYP domain-containing protein [Candidatus Cloacimonadota bacterium]
MSVIGIIEVIGLFAILSAFFVFVFGWNKALKKDTKFFLVALFILIIFHNLSNALEWISITKTFDNYETYLEILIPVMYGLFFYTFLIKRHEAKRLKAEKELEKTFDGIVRVISDILAVRDAFTSEHQKRTTVLAVKIAEAMELSEEKIKGLEVASKIHDIGKVAIPAEILNKPTSLNEREYFHIMQHSIMGYQFLKDIDFPWPIAKIIYQHHERLDGSGYPQGLTEDEIILEAKILAVADVVEAMSSHRPYRPALGIEAAKYEITEKKGKCFDAQVVDACINILEAGFKFN